MSPAEPNQPQNQDEEFETALMEVEKSLIALKQRYREIQQAQKRKLELTERANASSPELSSEVRSIKDELQQLEVTLESNLLSDGDVKILFWEGVRQGLLGEVVWQILRFGGLGVLLGWLLKTWTG
ncbi:MAG: hypothetical protein AAGF26_00475 [Cyanobacteria bacterium P01_G01_bin.49]